MNDVIDYEPWPPQAQAAGIHLAERGYSLLRMTFKSKVMEDDEGTEILGFIYGPQPNGSGWFCLAEILDNEDSPDNESAYRLTEHATFYGEIQ